MTYLATLQNFKIGLPADQEDAESTTHRQLTVRLSHDGFRYSARKVLSKNIKWHNRDEYVTVTIAIVPLTPNCYVSFYILDMSSYLQEMPFLASLQKQLSAHIIVYYSIKHKRMDIRFKKDGMPILMVSFEPGYPQHVEDKNLYLI